MFSWIINKSVSWAYVMTCDAMCVVHHIRFMMGANLLGQMSVRALVKCGCKMKGNIIGFRLDPSSGGITVI